MNETEYNNDLAINLFDLHNEWINHPDLCAKYTKLAAEAQSNYSRAKENFEIVKSQGKEELDRIKSEIDIDVRNNPQNYKIPKDKKEEYKLTELIINSVVTISPKYQQALKDFYKKRKDAHQKVIDTCLNRDILKGAADNFSYQRKAALENTVRLWEQEFYSVPNLPQAIKEQNIAKVATKIKNRTRRLSKERNGE